MINSIESLRLQRLIDSKKNLYEKRKTENPEDPYLLYLNSDITLLENEIMPIILCETTVDYSEIRNYVTLGMRRLEKSKMAKKITDVVFHFHIKDHDAGQQYVTAILSAMPIPKLIMDVYINDEQSLLYPL